MLLIASKTKWVVSSVVVLGLALASAIALPFLIDLEKFKPQIQAAVSSTVNADLDFKSIRLHGIPKLGVTIKNAEIRNTDSTFSGTTLFKTDEVFLATEFWPLLQGKLVGELRIVNPAVEMRLIQGSNNLASLAKAPAPGIPPATPPAGPEAQGTQTSQPLALDSTGIAHIRERVLIKSVLLTGASVSITSNGKPLARVSDLDFAIRNIGLDRDIDIALTTRLKAKEGGAVVGGAITAKLMARIETGPESLFKRLAFNGNLDLKELALNFQNALVKKPGQNIALRIRGAASPTSLQVDELGFDILNIAGTGNLAVSDFKTLKTMFSMDIESPDISSLGAMLPQHEKMLQKASLSVHAKVDGPVADLAALHADLIVESKLAGSDFNLAVNATSVMPARAQIKFTSKQIDLSALLKPFLPPAQAGGSTTGAATAGAAESATPGSPAAPGGASGTEKDFALSSELKETLKPHEVSVDVAMNAILWEKLTISNLAIKASLKELQLALQKFSLQALGGSVNADGKLNLSAAPLEFQGTFNLDGVSAGDALDVIAPAQREALTGKLSLAMAASARGTTRQTISKTLSGKGSYNISDLRVRGGELRPLVADAFAGFMSGLTSGKAAEKAIKNIEKFFNSPLGKRIPEDKRPKIDDLKKRIDGVKLVKIPTKYAGEKKVASSKGQFEMNDGKIRITSDTASDLGQFKLDAITTLEGDLSGNLDVALSETEKNGLLKQSEYAAMLLDKNKALPLSFKLGGNVLKPRLAMDTSGLTRNFEDNAAARLEMEAKKALEDSTRQAIKSALPSLGIDEKKADEITTKAQEAGKKLEAQAKDKLKGFFKKK